VLGWMHWTDPNQDHCPHCRAWGRQDPEARCQCHATGQSSSPSILSPVCADGHVPSPPDGA
jgi:hypothetical protein